MGVRSRYTDEQLAVALPQARTYRQLLLRLGVAPYGGNYEYVQRRIARCGLDASHLQRRRARSGAWLAAVDDEALASAVAANRSAAGVIRTLGGEPDGPGSTVIRLRIKRSGLDTTHFTGQAWSRGRRFGRRWPLSAYLCRTGKWISTTELRLRLIEEKVLAPMCAACGRSDWEGRPIPLELDHINGDRSDNRLANLRLLCPNCHALTPTYRGRNIGRTC